MKQLYKKAASQARKELQQGIGILVDDLHWLERQIDVNYDQVDKDDKITGYVHFAQERVKNLNSMFNQLNEVNNWLMIMEQ